jgi:hypothetical protein
MTQPSSVQRTYGTGSTANPRQAIPPANERNGVRLAKKSGAEIPGGANAGRTGDPYVGRTPRPLGHALAERLVGAWSVGIWALEPRSEDRPQWFRRLAAQRGINLEPTSRCAWLPSDRAAVSMDQRSS